MSNYDDDESSESAGHRLIREAREEAWHARRALHRDLPNASAEVKWQLATALADYRDLLVDYRDEDALNTPWDEREVDVDVIEDLLNQTTTTTETLDRRGDAQQTRTVPLIKSDKVSGTFLIEIAKELDAIYGELGFAAKAKSTKDKMFEVKRDPEDYDDSVKEEIPTPE